MGERLLPRNLPELFSHALAIEREATKRFAELERFTRDAGLDYLAEEFEAIGKEEKEQYELLAVGTSGRELPDISPWEYAWHYMGPAADRSPAPRNAREALALALAFERRSQHFYSDVAMNAPERTMSAFAADMANDEARHIARLEQLLSREPAPADLGEEEESLAERAERARPSS